MTYLDYKNELNSLKRGYLDFMFLVDDFQKEKLLAEVLRIDSVLKVMNSLYIEQFFEPIIFEFYLVESK